MKINVLNNNEFDTNTYVLVKNKDAIIIDPCVDVEQIEKVLEGSVVIAVLITHSHFDHIYTLKEIVDAFKCKVYISKNGLEKFSSSELNGAYLQQMDFKIELDKKSVVEIDEDENIKIGSFLIEILNTPGHTNCGLSFKIDDDLFCGDLLFKNGVGRYDLKTGSFLELRNSIKKVRKFENITIWPGHYENFVNKKH